MQNKEPERDRPEKEKGASPIEVTPEMVESAWNVLRRSGILESENDSYRDVVRSMLSVAMIARPAQN